MITYVQDPDRSLALRRLVGSDRSRPVWSGKYPDLFRGVPQQWYIVHSDGSFVSYSEAMLKAFQPLVKAADSFAIAIKKGLLCHE